MLSNATLRYAVLCYVLVTLHYVKSVLRRHSCCFEYEVLYAFKPLPFLISSMDLYTFHFLKDKISQDVLLNVRLIVLPLSSPIDK